MNEWKQRSGGEGERRGRATPWLTLNMGVRESGREREEEVQCVCVCVLKYVQGAAPGPEAQLTGNHFTSLGAADERPRPLCVCVCECVYVCVCASSGGSAGVAVALNRAT